uniref:Alpha-latrotoxin-Lh1a n=1 Tax=Lygus hesperus TaxID=30085 RepID=A0A0A9WFM4_LYGHE
MTPLCVATQANNIHCVEYLLDKGADVDKRSSHGRSPLLFAAESGHLSLMSYLINRGATNFTYNDQQLESNFISYHIRQGITRRDIYSVLKDDTLAGIVLDYLGLSGHRVRPIERLTSHISTSRVNKYTPRNHVYDYRGTNRIEEPGAFTKVDSKDVESCVGNDATASNVTHTHPAATTAAIDTAGPSPTSAEQPEGEPEVHEINK